MAGKAKIQWCWLRVALSVFRQGVSAAKAPTDLVDSISIMARLIFA